MRKNVNGCNIRFEVRENAQSAAIPVLFLHGWGCDLEYFAALMDAAQETATVIALDFPAHGKSDEPPVPWGVEDYALQVKQLLDLLHIARVDIVAHSFGVRVAIWLASHDPQLIGKMVFTGGAGIQKPATQAGDRRTAHYKRLKAMTRFLMKMPPLKTPMQKLQNKLIQIYGSKDYASLSEGMRATFVKIVSQDLTSYLQQITAPTLLIWGDHDTETPLWMGQTMEREIGDAGLVVFEGGSHFAFLEQRTRFWTIVKQFFWGGQAQ